MRITFRLGLVLCLTVGLLVVVAGGPKAGASTTTTVSYGSSPYQTMTVYPSSVSGAPLVILVHGGGWDSRAGKDYLPSEARDLQASGAAVFDTNYDTMPHNHGAFPQEIDDVVTATLWAIGNARRFGANPDNVEMIGGSAGGQLVAMAGEEIDAAAPGAVKSIVSLSGALDFVKKMQDISNGVVRGYFAVHAQEALGCSLRLGTCTTQLETEWSPAERVTSMNCPAASLIVNGSHEPEPVDQAESMTSALQLHGCAVIEIIRHGSQHSFEYWPSVQSEVLGFVHAH